ncbi:hypothetical protein [Kribbella sp. NPDC050459]|uniref:hypothetical protein n=1 Tax=Kribbella sp. NPDC050459 TaxID=3155785 RepID=UPI003404C0FA
MSLVYRSVFQDPDGGIAAAVQDAFGEWLGSKGLVVPADGLSHRGSPLESAEGAIAWASQSTLTNRNDGAVHRLRLIEESLDARWVTTLVWNTSGPDQVSGGWVWADLEHEPVGGRRVQRPGSPRLVRALLAAGEASDGGVPLTSDVWEVTSGHVDELVRHITSADRQVPVIVFAYDAQGAYDQKRLAERLSRDLAGVAAVFRLVDGAATERLAQRLPDDYAVYGGALRTYLPGAAKPDDTASRHRILGRASLVALGHRAFPAVKDQILGLSTRRPAPISTASALRAGAIPGVMPQASAAMPEVSERLGETGKSARLDVAIESPMLGRQWLRERARRIRAALGSPDDSSQLLDDPASFDDALDRLILSAQQVDDHRLTAGLAGLAADLQQARAERELLDQLLDAAQKELDQTSHEVRMLRAELEDLQLEATESVEAADQAERRSRWLARCLHDAGHPGVGTDDTLPTAPPSLAEVLVLAREKLHYLHIGSTDTNAAELDLHGNAQLYAIKAWSALIALNAYACARAEGRFASSFYAWCQQTPAGEPAISANAVALVESETVESNPVLHGARVFAVPKQVDPSGRIFMPAHIKVVKRGAPCPRLHFHDDSGGTGKVYVGYLGEHLPTARFS